MPGFDEPQDPRTSSAKKEPWERLRAGDPIAWSEFVARNTRMLRRYLASRGRLTTSADVDDLTMATWGRLFAKRHIIRSGDNLGALVRQFALRIHQNYTDTKWVRAVDLGKAQLEVVAPEREREEVEAARQCLERIRKDLRELLLLRHVLELTRKEIAETRDVSMGRVHRELTAARDAVKKCLEGKGIALARRANDEDDSSAWAALFEAALRPEVLRHETPTLERRAVDRIHERFMAKPSGCANAPPRPITAPDSEPASEDAPPLTPGPKGALPPPLVIAAPANDWHHRLARPALIVSALLGLIAAADLPPPPSSAIQFSHSAPRLSCMRLAAGQPARGARASAGRWAGTSTAGASPVPLSRGDLTGQCRVGSAGAGRSGLYSRP